MQIVALVVPFIAAGAWLWWLYRADRFEREPWPLVLKTVAVGAIGGAVGLIAQILLRILVPDEGAHLLAGLLFLVPIDVIGITSALFLLPYRNPAWNEPFDGVVYGGAAGIGYGLLYTLFALVDGADAGFRSAVFSIPIYMLAGLIIGHHMSQAKFTRGGKGWARGLTVAGLYLAGLELAAGLGGAVMNTEHPLASTVVYAANTIGWVLAMWAMEDQTRLSQFYAGNYRFWLAEAQCSHCQGAYPQGANFCNACGQPVTERKEAQG